MRLLRAFLSDTISWAMLVILIVTTVIGLSALITRYDRVEVDKSEERQLAFEIQQLKREKEVKTGWLARLDDDPAAWEQVAREKMNYLRGEEVLVTFSPAQASETP